MADNKERKRKKRGGDEDAEQAPPKEVSAPKKAKQAKGAPKWVVTFADLMSLLMCFFVMLLSMSEVDIEKFKAMIEGIDRGMDTKRSSKTSTKLKSPGRTSSGIQRKCPKPMPARFCNKPAVRHWVSIRSIL